MRSEKILVVAPHYWTFIKDQIEMLSSNLNQIYVIVTHPIKPKMDIFSISKKSYVDLSNVPSNVKVYEKDYLSLPLEIERKRRGDKSLKLVKKSIDNCQISFDILHAHFTWSSGYVGAKLKENSTKPLVITGHGFDVYDLPFRDEWWRSTITNVLNTADKIITVSNCNKDCFLKLGIPSKKVIVIPNGYNPARFYPFHSSKKRELGLPSRAKLILSVGNLEKVKGHAYLITAMNKIVHKRRDVYCAIIGDGIEKDRIKKHIKDQKLNGRVWLLGAKPHEEVPLWMNACDVFILPSLRESFGIAQVEAMACGKPIVATRNGGSEEILTSGDYGLLVEPRDPDALAEAVLKALSKEWDQDAILSRAREFTWAAIVNRILKVYESL